MRKFGCAETAASDVVGSILLVAITVIVGSLFGALILAMPGPVDTTRPDLVLAVNAGPDGLWGTGNENISIFHAGGEAMKRESSRVVIRHGPSETMLTGTALGGVFASASGLSIGTTWFSSAPLTISQGGDVAINVVALRSNSEVLVAFATIKAGT